MNTVPVTNRTSLPNRTVLKNFERHVAWAHLSQDLYHTMD